MSDLELLEKFLLNFAPVMAHPAIKSAFKDIRETPVQAMGYGFHYLKDAISEPGTDASACGVNGILLGIALGTGLPRSKDMRRMIEEYLDHKHKAKGENVVSLFAKKG